MGLCASTPKDISWTCVECKQIQSHPPGISTPKRCDDCWKKRLGQNENKKYKQGEKKVHEWKEQEREEAERMEAERKVMERKEKERQEIEKQKKKQEEEANKRKEKKEALEKRKQEVEMGLRLSKKRVHELKREQHLHSSKDVKVELDALCNQLETSFGSGSSHDTSSEDSEPPPPAPIMEAGSFRPKFQSEEEVAIELMKDHPVGTPPPPPSSSSSSSKFLQQRRQEEHKNRLVDAREFKKKQTAAEKNMTIKLPPAQMDRRPPMRRASPKAIESSVAANSNKPR